MYNFIGLNGQNNTLQKGDLIFKNICSKAEPGVLIQMGQLINSLSPWTDTKFNSVQWEHASIVVDDYPAIPSNINSISVAEAISQGVVRSNLVNTVDYFVLRTKNVPAQIPVIAANLAEALSVPSGNPAGTPYTVSGAIKSAMISSKTTPDITSIESRMETLFTGNEGVFCSQFVALCYSYADFYYSMTNKTAALNLIERFPETMTPASLVSLLKANTNPNWQVVGTIQRA